MTSGAGTSIVVVDNASVDGTAAHVRTLSPQVRVIRFRRNEGAFARTLGARQVQTPFIAFCDDDTWWLPGSIARAVHVLESHRRIALVNACVTVERNGRIDDACVATSTRGGGDDLPGSPIVRTDAFLHCGGYERRFMIGADETLLAFELHRRGWLVRYLPDVHVSHAACSQERDDARRRQLLIRNRLWVAWMRYRSASAWRATIEALGGLLWALSNRDLVDVSLQRRIDEVWSVSPR